MNAFVIAPSCYENVVSDGWNGPQGDFMGPPKRKRRDTYAEEGARHAPTVYWRTRVLVNLQ